MSRPRTFALRLLPVLAAVTASGWTFVACGGSGGGFAGGVANLFAGSASRADLSGQSSAYTGDLGAGTTITFPAVKGGSYLFQVATTDSDDEVVFDVYSEAGGHIRSKTVDAPGGWMYTHDGKTQHLLVFVRPWNPVDLGIKITSLTVTGTGPYAQDRFHVNFFTAGKFTGYGFHNDLASTADQAAFTDAVMARVRQLYTQTGIQISYEGFHYTAGQLQQQEPGLVAPDEQAICSAGESMSSTGFEQIATDGLNRYGRFGFGAADPVFARAHGIDVFVVHHFTKDGTVGLSPRPGQMTGNGNDTALVCAAFLRHQGTLIPRTPDQVATVLAHELGHFLGLQHTTTFDPSPSNPTRAIDDGLSDTPACTVLTDVNGDGIVGLGDGCQDEGNVMFYQAGAQTVFSTRQTNVMRALLSVQEH
jgi:hypothetical protein